MVLHVSGIKIEIWDNTSDLPFYVHINHLGEMVVYDHEHNEMDSESVMGQIIIDTAIQQLTPEYDLGLINLN